MRLIVVLMTVLTGTAMIPAAQETAGKADPLATKLLEEARAARATWDKFPGFAADIEVNLDGKVSRGKTSVTAAGKVSLQDLDSQAESWARRLLASLVAHRIDSGSEHNTPCSFVDENADHPLGRAVRVQSDDFHSSFRVKDRQIMMVNRQMKDTRFSIIVLENRGNKEGKFLPASFVVHYWNAKTGQLQKTEAHTQTWRRMGMFDLPVTTRIVTAGKEMTANSLSLSHHQLPGAAGAE